MQKISKLLFAVFNLLTLPYSVGTAASNFTESRMPIKSWQNNGSRGTKAEGICDLTYTSNSIIRTEKKKGSFIASKGLHKKEHTFVEFCKISRQRVIN